MLIGVFYGSTKNGGMQFALQLYAVVVSVVWSAVCTLIILILVDATIGLRVSLETEQMGLDMSHHRESVGTSSVHSDRLQRTLALQSITAQNMKVVIVDDNQIDQESPNLDGMELTRVAEVASDIDDKVDSPSSA
mmetsp:Transcript_4848/g.7209  ORF Transcript_4848/g.7209 Transcript_4848/m.7209 type:complete len:135 (-) Transcript_4848:280-684(-)